MDELQQNIHEAFLKASNLEKLPKNLESMSKKLYEGFVKQDVGLMLELLDKQNPTTRKAFEILFNGKLNLPRTQKGLKVILEDLFFKVRQELSRGQ